MKIRERDPLTGQISVDIIDTESRILAELIKSAGITIDDVPEELKEEVLRLLED